MHFNTSTFSGNVDLFHRFIEASKFAYAARSALGDIAFVENATQIVRNITSPEWAQMVRYEPKKWRKKINKNPQKIARK